MPFSSRIGFGARGGLEDAGHDRLVGAVAHDLGGGLAAHQQRQRIDQDGFARAGFAGEQVEPRAEDGDGVIDNSVIFGAKLDEHGCHDSSNGRGSVQIVPARPQTWAPVVSASCAKKANGIRAQHSMKRRVNDGWACIQMRQGASSSITWRPSPV